VVVARAETHPLDTAPKGPLSMGPWALREGERLELLVREEDWGLLYSRDELRPISIAMSLLPPFTFVKITGGPEISTTT